MQNKIVVIGCGNVGTSYIHALLNQKINIQEIAIIDINKEKVKGEVLDFNHTLPFLDLDIDIHLGDYQDCQNANIIVISAGANQDIGQTRLDLLAKNSKIIKDIVRNIMAYNFQGIILNATNPLDVITLAIYKESNLADNKVIGSGTFLDTARLKYYLHKQLNISYTKISAYVLGEHGDSATIPWGKCYIDNKKVTEYLNEKELKSIEKMVRNVGYELLYTKGFSSWAIGTCLAKITQIIINDQKEEVILSAYDEKEDVYYSYRVVLGKHGIVERKNLDLTNPEKKELAKSIKIIKEASKKIS